jgi:hypothetical protein
MNLCPSQSWARIEVFPSFGLIRYARGHISVLDRDGLEERSCEWYAVVKKEYDRLLARKPAA